MNARTLRRGLAAGTLLLFSTACGLGASTGSGWQEKFDLASCSMQTTGRNPYFVLEPGFELILEGGGVKLQVSVLNETKMVDGVNTRVVEEREWKQGKLYEVARNYFAMCEQTKDIYYFGENVDFYENDKIVKHDGT